MVLREDSDGALLSWPDWGGEVLWILPVMDVERKAFAKSVVHSPSDRFCHLFKFIVVRLLPPLFICFLQRPDR